ncbi:MAG: polysaccharide biosynthesis C-terminal domain-containing protein [Bacillota bacterium]
MKSSFAAGLFAASAAITQRAGFQMLPGWRRALTTVSMLGIATFLGAGMVFATQTLLARELGPSAYGLFASSLATVTMIAPLAGFGLSQFRLKVYGVEGWGANRWLLPSIRFTVATTVAAFAILIGWALIGAPPNGTRFALIVLSPVILSILTIELMGNKLRLEERLAQMALWQMAIPASRLLVAVALLLVPQLTGRFVAVSYSLIALFVFLAAFPQMRRMMQGKIDLHGHDQRREVANTATPGTLELWSQAWAYGVWAILYPVFFQISTILLKYLHSDAQAGVYSIALAIMTAIYLIPATIYQKYLLSKLHRWAAHDVPKFWAVYQQGNVAMFVLGVLVSIALVVVSPWVVPIVFGQRYLGVIDILMILALCPPIRFLSTAMGAALLTEDHMRYRVYAMAVATVVAIVLNAVLIPRFGGEGAAWATVVGETVLLLGTTLGVRRFHQRRGISRAGDAS